MIGRKLVSALTSQLDIRVHYLTKLFYSTTREVSHHPHFSNHGKRVIFFGSDKFSLRHLVALHNMKKKNESVISSISVTTTSRSTPVYKYAIGNGIPTFLWVDVESLGRKSVRDSDIGILASFGRMLPQWLLEEIPVINIHPSLLPRWRGSSPIAFPILRGDSETGVSIMQIRPHQFDRGPILLQDRIPVPNCISLNELTLQLADMGSEMLVEVLANLDSYWSEMKEQASSGVTVARRIREEDSLVDWDNMNCDQIDRLYRSVGNIYPLRTHYDGMLVKLYGFRSRHDVKMLFLEHPELKSFLIGSDDRLETGRIKVSKKHPNIAFVKSYGPIDEWSAFDSILIGREPTRKNRMNGIGFYNGFLSKSQVDRFQSQRNRLFRCRIDSSSTVELNAKS